MINRNPFTLISGQGLGITNSSLNQIGPILPAKGYGQADIMAYVNVATGNVCLYDYDLDVKEQNDKLNFCFIHNSLAEGNNSWHFSEDKRFKQAVPRPEKDKAAPKSFVLIEGDGHETVFTQHPDSVEIYFAPATENGVPYFMFDTSRDQWRWHHPAKKITEYYTEEGLLDKRIDAEGREIEFKYDMKDPARPLKEIIVPISRTSYEIKRYNTSSGSSVEIICNKTNTPPKLLKRCQFDEKRRLVKTQIPLTDESTEKFYEIQFGYTAGKYQVDSILQSDKTKMTLSYGYKVPGKLMLDAIILGSGQESQNSTVFSYNPSETTIRDSAACLTNVTFDKAFHVLKVARQAGIQQANPEFDVSLESTSLDVTNYQYTTVGSTIHAGQLLSIASPGGGIETFNYHNIFGLMTRHTRPDGQIRELYHNRGDIQKKSGGTGDEKEIKSSVYEPQIINQISQVEFDQKKSMVTYRSYDRGFGSSKKNVFLRFEISPLGCVTEYRPDSSGNIASKRVYLKAQFDTKDLKYDVDVSPDIIEKWAAKQNFQEVALTDYGCDNSGNIIKQRDFSSVDSKGEGVVNSTMGLRTSTWNLSGNLLTQSTTQDEKDIAKLEQKFDGLQRLTLASQKLTNEINLITEYPYNDEKAVCSTILPNGRVESQHRNTRGIILSEVHEVGSAKRETQYVHNAADLPIVIKRPDGQKAVQFFDRQRRLIFTIIPIESPDKNNEYGKVIENKYDVVNRYTASVQYDTTVKLSDFWRPPLNPSSSLFLVVLKESKTDRNSYEFFDKSKRLKYKVDENQYLTEFVYDERDNVTRKILYKAPLNNSQLDLLKNGNTLDLPLDFDNDRILTIFYNEDNQITLEQDSGLYVTAYERNAAGLIIQTSRAIFDRQIEKNESENIKNEFIKKLNSDVIHTHYYYNSRNQCIAEVDALNYYTKRTYLANGLRDSVKRFENKITNSEWFKDKSKMPVPPVASSEDQTTKYQYDLLSRNIRIDEPGKKATLMAYNEMSQKISEKTFDSANPGNIDPTHQRGTEVRYDAWEQALSEANEFITQELTKIDADPRLTPTEKIAAKEKVWQEKSIRHTYDNVTGLKLKTTDSLNAVTYFYYDKERRPVVAIGPTGSIQEITLSHFNEELKIRRYITPYPSDKMPELKGGFITSDFQTILNSLKIADKDSINTLEYDKRSQVIKKTDSESHQFKNEYNAFKECIKEVLLHGEAAQITKIHTFNTRGLETETTTQGGNLTTQVLREYKSPYNKQTALVDEAKQRTENHHDSLGRIKKIIDPLNACRNFEPDAFNRITEEKNSLGNGINNQFNQAARTCKSFSLSTGVSQTTTHNVFDQPVCIEDAAGSNSIRYAPNGKVCLHEDPLGNTQCDNYDDMGQPDFHIDANKTKTEFKHDKSGVLTETLVDVGGLEIKTTNIPDALGRAQVVIDPQKVAHVNQFDRCDRLTQSTTDPVNGESGLHLVTQNAFNGLGSITNVTRGNLQNPHQAHDTFQQDGLNRTIAHIVDPERLAIATQSHLDERSQIIASINAEGNTTRYFYDERKRKRFEIDPLGGVIEFIYDSENKISEVQYEASINVSDLKDETKLIEIEKWAKNNYSADNTAIYFFYDEDKRERFRLTGLGAIEESIYDTANRKIRSIKYATNVDPAQSKIENLTTKTLMEFVKIKSDINNDRITYRVFDAKKQERFIIDSAGVITEQRYDAMGHIIAKIQYANRVDNPAAIAQLTEDKVLSQIKIDVSQDRAEYKIYDSIGRLQFKVMPAGDLDNQYKVVRYDYDKMSNLLMECQFSQSIVLPSRYEDLVVEAARLVPDKKSDRISTFKYDRANRCVEKSDALGNSETFLLDALGNIKIHTDRGQYVWENKFDTAQRLYERTTPEVLIANIQFDEKDPGKVTSFKNEKSEIHTYLNRDKLGRIKNRINAYGRSDAIQKDIIYNACNKPIGTQRKKASGVSVVQTTQIIRNAKQLKIAKKSLLGEWTYYIYNANNELVYTINNVGRVIERIRNNFNEVREKHYYETALSLKNMAKLQEYINKNQSIPISFVKSIVVSKPSDKLKILKYDQRGDVISIGAGSVSDSKRNDNLPAQCDRRFNAFHEWYYKSSPLNDLKKSTPSDSKLLLEHKRVSQRLREEFRWYNRQGKTLAECAANKKVTRRSFNTFAEEQKRSEWANPPAITLAPETPLSALDASHVASPADRNFKFEIDQRGKVFKKTQEGVVTQAVVIDPETGNPKIVNKTSDIVRVHEFDAREQEIKTTEANGKSKFAYYNGAKQKIAETDVSRELQESKQDAATVVPLKTFDRNAHGTVVCERNFKNGTQNPQPEILPTSTQDSDDQICVTKVDEINRQIAVTADPIMAERDRCLAITTQTVLDIGSQPVSVINPNGKVTRFFYELGLKRLSVDPMGGVIEWRYDTNKRCISHRKYDIAADPLKFNDTTTLNQALALIKDSSTNYDTVTRYFYDARHCERFRINSLGVVEEDCYDLAGYKTETIRYETRIDIKQISSMSLQELITWASGAAQDKDVHTCHIVDTAGLDRFTIDPEGAVVENIFDTFNRVVEKIRYINKINPKDIPALTILPPEEVREKLHKDPKQDSVSYVFYHSFNSEKLVDSQIEYEVDAENNVTRYGYDESGNKIFKYCYEMKVAPQKTYAELHAALSELKLNPALDRLTQYRYNDANQCIAEVDAAQNANRFGVDIFGNPVSHIDPKNNEFKTNFNRVNLKSSIITPEVEITPVVADSTRENHYVPQNTIKTKLKTVFEQDKMGNETKLTEAADTKGQKELSTKYDDCGRLCEVQIPNVPVEDEKNPLSSFLARPERLVTITTKNIFNAKGFVVAEKNENDHWTFYVRDAENNLIYSVNPRKRVIAYILDNSNKVTQIKCYANALKIDLSHYLNKNGLPRAILEAELEKIGSPGDRTSNRRLDKRGDCFEQTSDEVDFAVPDPNPGASSSSVIIKAPISGKGRVTSVTEYNAFRNPIQNKSLYMDFSGRANWAITSMWYDRNQQLSATLDPEGYAIRYTRNSFDEEVLRLESALNITQRPDLHQSKKYLDKLIQDSERDRQYITEHDFISRVTARTRSGFLGYDQVTNVPRFGNLTQSFGHDSTSTNNKPISITLENGKTQYFYYNALHWTLAVTQVPRQDPDHHILIPLIRLGHDYAGQVVCSTTYKNGTKEAKPGILPVAIEDKEDQQQLSIFDIRGLQQIKQAGLRDDSKCTDSVKYSLNGTVYTPSKKPAREFFKMTFSGEHPSVYSIDDKRTQYDESNNTVRVTLLRNNKVETPKEDVTEFDYNGFEECIAEGPAGSRPVCVEYDLVGRIWKSNAEKGSYNLLMYNLNASAAQEAVVMASPKIHLDKFRYDQVKELLNEAAGIIDRIDKVRDKIHQVTIQRAPSYKQDAVIPDNVPLNITSYLFPGMGKDEKSRESNSVLKWPLPQERNIDYNDLSIELTPITSTGKKTSMRVADLKISIDKENNLCVVDVSHLESGIYYYSIKYSVLPPASMSMIAGSIEAYKSDGQIQFVTENNVGSLSVVPMPELGGKVILKGRTNDITHVSLRLVPAAEYVDIVEVKTDEKTGEKYIDLTDKASGEYSIIPLPSEGGSLAESLPFTLYTKKDSVAPLSKEVTCDTTIKFLKNHVQCNWSVPKIYHNQYIKVAISYTGDDDESYHTDDILLNRDVPITKYTDSQGNILYSNLELLKPIKKLQTITLHLDVSEDKDIKEWVLIRKLEPAQNPDVPVTPDIITTHHFLQRDILYITPLPEFKIAPHLQYLDTSLGSAAEWSYLQTIDAVEGRGVVLDVSTMPLGVYPFQTERGETTGKFSISRGGSTFQAVAWDERIKLKNILDEMKLSGKTDLSSIVHMQDKNLQGEITVTPRQRFQYDHWSITACSDAEDNKTETDFNINDQLVRLIKPEVIVTEPDDSLIKCKPVFYNGYSLLGGKTWEKNGNGDVEQWLRDEADQVVIHIIGGDKIERVQYWNALAQMEKYYDSKNFWGKKYNYASCVTQLINPIQKYNFVVNELTDHIVILDPANYRTHRIYDVRRNIIGTILPGGQYTIEAFDRRNQSVRLVYPGNIGQLISQRDYWGNLHTHTDLNHGTNNYKHDLEMQLIEEKITGGDYNIPNVIATKFRRWITSLDKSKVLADELKLEDVANNRRHITSEYNANRLMRLIDCNTAKQTKFGYDRNGRRIRQETNAGDGRVVQIVSSKLDSHGRDSWVLDRFMSLVKSFDRAGRTRRHRMELYVDGKTVVVGDRLIRHDDASRVIQDDKLQLVYDARGLRWKEITETGTRVLGYDADKRLIDVTGPNYHSRRDYDPQDYVKHYVERNGNKSTDHHTQCNINGWMVTDEGADVESKEESNHPADFKACDREPQSTTSSQSTMSNFNGLGMPEKTVTDYQFKDGKGRDTLDTLYFPRGDNLERAVVKGIREIDGIDPVTVQAMRIWCDSNGYITAVSGADDGTGQKAENIFFENTVEGIPIIKRIGAPVTVGGFFHKEFMLACAGVEIPLMDVNGSHWACYRVMYKDLFVGHLSGTTNLRFNSFATRNGKSVEQGLSANLQRRMPQLNYMPSKRTTLYNTMEKVSQSYPPPSLEKYKACPGDTFEKIAIKTKGDSSYAAIIAEANGYVEGMKIDRAQELVIPQLISSHHNALTSPNYQAFRNTMINSIRLHMTNPVPDNDDDDDMFSGILGIVIVGVALVAAPYLAGAALSVMGFGSAAAVAAASASGACLAAGTSITTILGASIATGVAAGLITAAEQGLAVATGLQNNFSWQTVIQTSVTAGLGVGNTAGMSPKTLEFGAKVLRISQFAVARQLTQMALGLSPRFNLQEVISTITNQLASTYIGSNVPVALRDSVNTGLGSVINSAITRQPINIQQVAMEAFGNTATSYVGSVVNEHYNAKNSGGVKLPELAPEAKGLEKRAERSRPNSTAPTSLSRDLTSKQFSEIDRTLALADRAAKTKIGIEISNSGFTTPAGHELSVISSNSRMAAQAGRVENKNGIRKTQQEQKVISSNNSSATSYANSTMLSTLNILGRLGGSAPVTAINQTGAGVANYLDSRSAEILTATAETLTTAANATGNFIQSIQYETLTNFTTFTARYSDGMERLAAGGNLALTASTVIPVVGEIPLLGRGLAMYGNEVFSAISAGLDVASIKAFTLSAEFSKRFSSVDQATLEAVAYRQARMIEKNTGYNISPVSWFKNFPFIGKHGTYITDYPAIAQVIGPMRANSELKVGLFTSLNSSVSYIKARRLEQGLGIKIGSLSEGLRFTRIPNISQRSVRPVTGGNGYYKGIGAGLPNKGPELIIDSIPANPWPPRGW